MIYNYILYNLLIINHIIYYIVKILLVWYIFVNKFLNYDNIKVLLYI